MYRSPKAYWCDHLWIAFHFQNEKSENNFELVYDRKKISSLCRLCIKYIVSSQSAAGQFDVRLKINRVGDDITESAGLEQT